jgi:phage-related protein
MTRLSDWLNSDWNTVKNVAGKVGNFIGKSAQMVDSFIGNVAPLVCNI